MAWPRLPTTELDPVEKLQNVRKSFPPSLLLCALLKTKSSEVNEALQAPHDGLRVPDAALLRVSA